MPRYYLLRPDGSYSDAADYPELPPAREDGEWVEGKPEGLDPYQAPNPVKTIKDLVAAMEPVVLMRYAGETSLIGQFLNESNLPGAVGLLNVLAAKIEQAEDTEAQAALAPVLAVLNG